MYIVQSRSWGQYNLTKKMMINKNEIEKIMRQI
jgi:hypothetical protein